MKKVSAAVAAVLVSGAVMSTAATAHAQNFQPTTKVMTVTMTAHQIRQARTAGAYTVVTLDNDQQIKLSTAGYRRARAMLAAQKAHNATPDTTVRGNCGTAHVELNNTSTHLQYRMNTGFTVSPPAVEYGWSVYINGAADTRYEYHYRSGSTLAGDSTWSGGHTAKVPAANDYEADIDVGGSWALTANATLCSSAPASELTRIF